MVDDFKGRGGSPWGTPPPGGDGNGSGRGPRPPDIEELIRNFQNKINNIYKVNHVEQSPISVPSSDLIQGMGTMVADNRAKLDNIAALMQIGGLSL